MRPGSIPCVFACLAALLASGCVHHLGGAKLPARGWHVAPADAVAVSSALPQRPTLRVLVAHSFWYGDHAALSVASPSGLFAFWDPAGWFADDKGWKDCRDVIHRPFDLCYYWRWRSVDYDGLDLLVFEWEVPESEARRIHRLLSSGCYGTWTLPGLCGANVVNFVQTHVPRLCPPPPPFSLFPGLLGEVLWSQHPDRVLVFHAGRGPRAYRPALRATHP